MSIRFFVIQINNYTSRSSMFVEWEGGWFIGSRRPCGLDLALHFKSERSAQRYLESYVEHGRKKKLPRMEYELEIIPVDCSSCPKNIVAD